MKRLILLFIIMLGLGSMYGCGYNSMQGAEERVNEAWGNVESAMQRRADLIPNLVEVVKGYAKHEKETLTQVIEARAKATSIRLEAKDLNDAKKIAEFNASQGQLTQALGKLMMITENYPQLKADQHFRDLQAALEGSENRINVARQDYNKRVAEFNTMIRSFPFNITNNMFLNLERKEPFKGDENSKKVPNVKFGE